jgi:hypothetical protein
MLDGARGVTGAILSPPTRLGSDFWKVALPHLGFPSPQDEIQGRSDLVIGQVVLEQINFRLLFNFLDNRRPRCHSELGEL